METTNDCAPRRLHVVDVKSSDAPAYVTHGRQSASNRKRRRKKHIKRQEEHVEPVPMELVPVLDVIKAYGRKTHALGKLEAATILTDITTQLKKMEPLSPALRELAHNAEKKAESIRRALNVAYEEEIENSL